VRPNLAGIFVGFVACLILVVACSAFFVAGMGTESSGGQSIDHEPISLEQAHDWINRGQVYRILENRHVGVDKFCYFLLNNSEGSSCQWEVDGIDVHLCSSATPTGVPILSHDSDDTVGLTSAELDALRGWVETYNASAGDGQPTVTFGSSCFGT
jgi:hypothetical protein